MSDEPAKRNRFLNLRKKIQTTKREYWRNFTSAIDNPSNRRIVLISTVVLSLLFTVFLELLTRQPWMTWFREIVRSSSFAGDVFFPPKQPEWKDKLTALLPIIAIPVAFWLWHWRDANVQDQIENSRKDVNLREFQDVQQRAAGAFENHVSEEAANQLQIAGIHQLRSFVRGDYGDGFRRPAIELLLAGHEEALRRIAINSEAATNNYQEFFAHDYRSELRQVDIVRLDVISREFSSIMSSGLPLEGRKLDLISFNSRIKLAGARLADVSLQGARLMFSDLSDADLRWANLRGAVLAGANLRHANLYQANLRGANLRNADISGAHMSRAKVSASTTLDGLMFNSNTMFNEFGTAHDWRNFSEQEKEAERKKWEARGAVRHPKLG